MIDTGGIAKEVDILGERYSIDIVKPEEDEGFKGRHNGALGYCDQMSKRIVISNRDKPDWTDRDRLNALRWMKKTIRHEIVHAFLFESGLSHNTRISASWAMNEEMIDWFAIQGPKIGAAWAEAGALAMPGSCCEERGDKA